jgi:hypothetical protein
MKKSFNIDEYILEKGTLGNPVYLVFCGDMADQLQILLAEITRPGGEGEINLSNIRQGIGKAGQGIGYECYPLGSEFLDNPKFPDFQDWWERSNQRPLEGPIWTAILAWEPGVEGFIPHSTLMKIYDLQVALLAKDKEA